MSSIPQGSLLQRFRTTAVVWLAMLVSVVLYALIVEAFHRGWIVTGQPADIPNGNRIHIILLGLSVMTFFMAGAIKTIILRGLETPAVTSPAEAAGKLQGATIIAAALSESIVIVGLVEYMLLRRYGSFYLFAALSVVGFLVHAPRVSQWMRLAGTDNSLES